MAGKNDFKAFATAAGANVTSQEDWEALPALQNGFSSGKASSAQVSKGLRQPSTMAAVIGQFIANADLDALDNGDISGLVEKLTEALGVNLELGSAAKKDAGTGTNQIPDMSSFSRNLVTLGYQKLPGGLIIQWGRVSPPNPGASVAVSFAVTFSTLFGLSIALNGTSNNTGCSGATTTSLNSSGFNWTMLPGSSYGSLASSYWIAVGV
ncbi:TPA: phage tail protein [Escherichia coli]|nr:phage tail protein [Escherichia coli]HAZ7432991.1 phage tail protein [Escherichia coli]